MAENTKIEWATHSFSPWLGCSEVSIGCARCYAKAMAGRLGVKWGPHGTRRRTAESTWRQVEKWNRRAVCKCSSWMVDDEHFHACPQSDRPRVFPSLCDIFEEHPLVEWSEFSKGYRVSIYGEIQSRWRPGGSFVDEWKTLNPRVGERGYLYFNARGDVGKTVKVHQIVLRAFVGEPPAGCVARHIDGNTLNNCLWNLCYGTQKENQEDMQRHGTTRSGERNGRAKLSVGDICAIKEAYAAGESQSSIGGRYGVGQAAVSKIVRGASWVVPEGVPAMEIVRHHGVGHILGSDGRPLFHENFGYSAEPDGVATDCWNPVTIADVRRDFFALIDRCDNLDFLLLTKRPENVRSMWRGCEDDVVQRNLMRNRRRYHRENCWLLYSASDQQSLEAGLPHLLACRDLVPVLGLSLEPLIGPVNLQVAPGQPRIDLGMCRGSFPKVDWVIVGGESGPRHRPMEVAWLESIADQCSAAGVPLFVKQDAGPKPGQQGHIPNHLWDRKELPS